MSSLKGNKDKFFVSVLAVKLDDINSCSKYAFHISCLFLFNACKYPSRVDNKYKLTLSSISFDFIFRKYLVGRVFDIKSGNEYIYENNKIKRNI